MTNFLRTNFVVLNPGGYSSATPLRKKAGFYVFLFLFFLAVIPLVAQESKVKASVDTTSILIGDQVIYKITVETNPSNLVVFPEGETFNPMEVVESLTADTNRVENRFRLLKEYSLTQFDSGTYTIPSQRVLINDTPYFTDSIRIEVVDVVVDTTKQKMFAIKPPMEVPSGFSIPVWVWWFLGILLLAAALYFLLKRRKKILEARKQLPPYERALFELQELDKSHLLENRQTKEYYSKLTEAVRRYIEDEVHLRAMESTTSELIQDLELKMDRGELNLSRQTIDELKIILQRADLAKFANSRPDIITAKGDRSKIEHVINDTKAAIPEPTEEELLKDEEYRRAQLKRKNRRKIVLAVGVGILIIAVGVTAIVTTQGFSGLRNVVFGNPSKQLLQGEWITSDYGDPVVNITTPRVLKRGEIDIPREAQAMLVGSETFIDGDLAEDLYVVLSTVRFQEGVKFELKTAVEGVYANLEQKGAKNIIVKEEEFTTLEGAKGIKVFGTLELENPKNNNIQTKEYLILNFAEKGGFQQITVIFDAEDEFAEEIAGRIINSVEFENTGN
ncbi:MAG TPA: BatD family protein [Gillisia sp.]|nr:BatD family protein [Gillisia sp.]